eukprot:1143046-Pelagomonas_calceolata.AAC.6
MKRRSLDEFMCQNSGLRVTFEWPSVNFAGCISQRRVKVQRTAHLKCKRMRVKFKFKFECEVCRTEQHCFGHETSK